MESTRPKLPKEAIYLYNLFIHGKIDRDDYTVEKVFFQSHPNFYVTGNLYRPKGKTGPFPAVLCPHGHWANGRFNETRKSPEGHQEFCYSYRSRWVRFRAAPSPDAAAPGPDVRKTASLR